MSKEKFDLKCCARVSSLDLSDMAGPEAEFRGGIGEVLLRSLLVVDHKILSDGAIEARKDW